MRITFRCLCYPSSTNNNAAGIANPQPIHTPPSNPYPKFAGTSIRDVKPDTNASGVASCSWFVTSNAAGVDGGGGGDTYSTRSNASGVVNPLPSIYNPQNEMFVPLKTKRSLLKNEMYYFSKNIDPASPGFIESFNSLFEWPSNSVRRPFFSLLVASRPLFALSFTRSRLSIYTRSRFAL